MHGIGADLVPFISSSAPGIYHVSYLAVAGGVHDMKLSYTNPKGTVSGLYLQ
jgi:hypothetical protein